MTVINPNSISGITSITMPSGDGNVLTIHTNDGTERFRIDSSGNIKVGSAATISPDGDVFFTGVTTATTFTGAHSGSGANLTSLPAAQLSGTLPAISATNLTNIPAANVTGTLPALTAANLTNIPAANIVGVCTSGLTKTGGFGSRTVGTSYALSAPDKSHIDFTSFGTLTRFEIHFNAVSQDSAAEFGVRLGTGGSVDTSGYLCQSAYVRSSDHSGEAQTSGFFTHGLASASYSSNGVVRCWRVDSTQHKWYLLADIYEYGSDNHWYYMKGYRTLSGELDIIRVLPESGNFDGGNLRLVTYTD